MVVNECVFFCLDLNHLIADCKAWKQKNATSKLKNVALVGTPHNVSSPSEESYQHFLFEGVVSLSPDSDFKTVTSCETLGPRNPLYLLTYCLFLQSLLLVMTC